MFITDAEKKYFLSDTGLIVSDLLDPDDVVEVSKKDFSEFENSAYQFLLNEVTA